MYVDMVEFDVPEVDAVLCTPDGEMLVGVTDFFYWRKHPNLHGLMTDLYVARGGMEDLNVVGNLKLTEQDLDEIERRTRDGNLPYTQGFFFGESTEYHDEETLNFVSQARAALRDGKNLLYSAWW